MKRVHAGLGGRTLVEQPLEHAPTDLGRAFVWVQQHGEVDAITLVVPSGVFWEFEKHLRPPGGREQNVPIMFQSAGGRMPVQGERIAGFILITGIDGIRYAVRQHAVSVISDHDEAQDETQIVLHGGAVVRVPC
jgi:hypothetical protein